MNRDEMIAALERAIEIEDEGEMSSRPLIYSVIASLRSAPPQTESSVIKEALAWAYQFAGARGACAEALDNLSALSHGSNPPHEWPVVLPAPPQEGMREALAEYEHQHNMLAAYESAGAVQLCGCAYCEAARAALAAPHVPTDTAAVLAEREACAQIADKLSTYPTLAREISGFTSSVAIAAAIRARTSDPDSPALEAQAKEGK